MVLIFEGSNKVGKTTLISALCSKLDESNTKYFVVNDRLAVNDSKINPEDIALELEHRLKFIKAITKCNDNALFIFDRLHLSEFVYGVLFRNYQNDAMYRIDKMLYDMDAKMILMHSDYKHILDSDKKNEYLSIQDLMQKVQPLLKVNTKLMTLHKSNPDFNVKEIIRFIGEETKWKN